MEFEPPRWEALPERDVGRRAKGDDSYRVRHQADCELTRRIRSGSRDAVMVLCALGRSIIHHLWPCFLLPIFMPRILTAHIEAIKPCARRGPGMVLEYGFVIPPRTKRAVLTPGCRHVMSNLHTIISRDVGVQRLVLSHFLLHNCAVVLVAFLVRSVRSCPLLGSG